MASFELKLTGLQSWEAMFSRLASKDNWKTILRKVASVIAFKDVIDHFKNERGEDGAWAEWSPAYKKYRERLANRLATPAAKRRARRLGVQPVAFSKKLVLTGSLRQKFLTPFDQPKGDAVAVLENYAKYAKRHDQGTGGMPQRQFMWLGNNAMDLIAKGFLYNLSRSAR